MNWIEMKALIDIKYVITFVVMLLASTIVTVTLADHLADNRQTAFEKSVQTEFQTWVDDYGLKYASLVDKYYDLSDQQTATAKENIELRQKLSLDTTVSQQTNLDAINAINSAWNQSATTMSQLSESQQNITAKRGEKCITLSGITTCYKVRHSGGSGGGSAIVS